MHIFEQLLVDLLIAGQYLGPVFIKSKNGVAILNASEAGAAAIIQAHQNAAPAKPVLTPVQTPAPVPTSN